MKSVIFDLDGTLCDSSHRQHYLTETPRNWGKFFDACVNDVPHEHVLSLYHMVKDHVGIVLCSGRPDSHREVTEQWLEQHSVQFDVLMMRKTGDYRPDHVIKKEMLDQLRNLEHEILFAVDDRTTVVQMWRANGVPVFQVEDSTVA